MIAVVVGKAPDHRGPVHDPGMEGHLVGDPQTGKTGGNRSVGSAVFPGRIGLHVEGVELRGTPVLPDEDHRPPALTSGPCSLSPEEMRQGETESTQGASGDKLAPAESVTEPPGWTRNCKHFKPFQESSTQEETKRSKKYLLGPGNRNFIRARRDIKVCSTKRAPRPLHAGREKTAAQLRFRAKPGGVKMTAEK